METTHLNGEMLRLGLLAGCDYVQSQRTELNRINVFPVPDGDTGTNLALTAAAIADRMRTLHDRSAARVAHAAAEAAILGARGNCGMILSHFLLGFAEGMDGQPRLTPGQFARALNEAAQHVYAALEKPVEGTIITVMREVAEEAERTATGNFDDLIELLLVRAHSALARTPDLLPQLRAAGVVDAGAKGFVHIMEGIAAFAKGDPFVPVAGPTHYEAPAAAAAVDYPAGSESFRFCTEALVRGGQLPSADVVRSALRGFGDSLIVIRGTDVLKVHVHTDEPESVFAYLRGTGQLVTHKAEDMRAQHAAVERAAASHVQLARRSVTIVTDSAGDLAHEIIQAHGIHVVPLSVVYGTEVLRDGVDIDSATFTQRMRDGQFATTSQPPPAAFLEAFRRAAEDGEHILAVLLSSGLSGTYASAEAAAKQFREVPIRLVDSRGASLKQGLLVLKAAELAELGHGAEEIALELERIRNQSGIYFTVDTFDRLLASGRVGRGQVMIAGLLDIKPILGINMDGKVEPAAKVRGRQHVLSRMIDLIEEQLPANATALRFGIVQVDYPEIVEDVTAELQQRFGAHREILTAAVTPVVATHLGPRAWGVAWQLED